MGRLPLERYVKMGKDGLEECRIELPTKTHGNMIGVYLCNQAQAEPQNVCVYHEEEHFGQTNRGKCYLWHDF